MRLTREQHPETLGRYGHIKPARGRGAVVCSERCPGSARTCTRERGHSGPHVAHGRRRRVDAVWDSGSSPVPVTRETWSPSDPEEHVSVAVRVRALVGEAWSRALHTVSSVEQLVFLVLFLAFVGFAIHWLMLVAGIG